MISHTYAVRKINKIVVLVDKYMNEHNLKILNEGYNTRFSSFSAELSGIDLSISRMRNLPELYAVIIARI